MLKRTYEKGRVLRSTKCHEGRVLDFAYGIPGGVEVDGQTPLDVVIYIRGLAYNTLPYDALSLIQSKEYQVQDAPKGLKRLAFAITTMRERLRSEAQDLIGQITTFEEELLQLDKEEEMDFWRGKPGSLFGSVMTKFFRQGDNDKLLTPTLATAVSPFNNFFTFFPGGHRRQWQKDPKSKRLCKDIDTVAKELGIEEILEEIMRSNRKNSATNERYAKALSEGGPKPKTSEFAGTNCYFESERYLNATLRLYQALRARGYTATDLTA